MCNDLDVRYDVELSLHKPELNPSVTYHKTGRPVQKDENGKTC